MFRKPLNKQNIKQRPAENANLSGNDNNVHVIKKCTKNERKLKIDVTYYTTFRQIIIILLFVVCLHHWV